MQPDFSIDIDRRRDFACIRLSGLFDDATMRSFLAARASAFQRFRCAPNQHLCLIDVRTMAIQTQEMVARWGAVLADPAYHSRRLGFVVATTLARAQLQRVMDSRDARVFTDIAEAERWVVHGDVAQAA